MSVCLWLMQLTDDSIVTPSAWPYVTTKTNSIMERRQRLHPAFPLRAARSIRHSALTDGGAGPRAPNGVDRPFYTNRANVCRISRVSVCVVRCSFARKTTARGKPLTSGQPTAVLVATKARYFLRDLGRVCRWKTRQKKLYVFIVYPLWCFDFTAETVCFRCLVVILPTHLVLAPKKGLNMEKACWGKSRCSVNGTCVQVTATHCERHMALLFYFE